MAAETDGDYHIQISSSPDTQENCVIVEVPNPDPEFVATASLRPFLKKTRDFVKAKLLRGREPSSVGSVMQHATFVAVTG